MQFKSKIKSYTILYIKILILLLVLVPKKIGIILNILPFRLILLCILPIIFYIEYKFKKIKINDFKFKYLFIFYIIFLIFTFTSLFTTKNIHITIYSILKFIIFGIDFMIISKIKFQKKDFIDIVKCFIISILIVSLYGIYQYVKYIDLNYNGTEKYFGIRGRIISTFFNPIYYGIFINLIFIFILYIKQSKLIKSKIFNTLLIILPIILYFTLVLTFTRSTLLVFWGIIFLTLITNYKIIINKISVITLILCLSFHFIVPGAIYVAKSTIYYGLDIFYITDLYQTIVKDNQANILGDDKNKAIYENDSSVEHRKDFADIGIKIANDNPIIGVGLGSYIDYMYSEDFDIHYPTYDKIKDFPHAGFILLAAETGYISVTFFILSLCIIIIPFIKSFYKNFKEKNEIYKISSISLEVFIGLLITTIVSENPIYDTQLFTLFLIIISLSLNYIYTFQTKK